MEKIASRILRNVCVQGLTRVELAGRDCSARSSPRTAGSSPNRRPRRGPTACNGCLMARGGMQTRSARSSCTYAVEHLGDPWAVLVIDETGCLNQGTKSV